MKKVNWLIVGIVGALLLVFLFGGGMMMNGRVYRGGVMMGPGGMTGNLGYSPFGWMGMLFMGLVSVGIITLIILGIVWLVRKVGSSTSSS